MLCWKEEKKNNKKKRNEKHKISESINYALHVSVYIDALKLGEKKNTVKAKSQTI